MPRRLVIIGIVLIEWTLLAAELSGRWQYYVWALLVFYLWTEAVHKRNPSLYPKRSFRIMFLMTLFFLPMFIVNKMYFFILENGIVIPQIAPAGGFIHLLSVISNWFIS